MTDDDRDKYRGYTDAAIFGINIIKDIPSERLQAILDSDASGFESLRVQIGSSTNPRWLTARIAAELYDRGDIDEQTFDWLMR